MGSISGVPIESRARQEEAYLGNVCYLKDANLDKANLHGVVIGYTTSAPLTRPYHLSIVFS